MKTIVLTLFTAAIGAGFIQAIRKLLTPGFPLSAIGSAIVVVTATLLLISEVAGLNTSLLFPGILVAGTFAGTICAQQSLWSPASILRGLGVSAGSITVVAAFATNYTAAALALLATGVLTKLHMDISASRAVCQE
ncbi:MAG TPA: hypothetical protein VNQ32_13800 [Steroidobacteraceae bacterium]|nr:hypothetical protein [Steroidobacteraceae bacterium]